MGSSLRWTHGCIFFFFFLELKTWPFRVTSGKNSNSFQVMCWSLSSAQINQPGEPTKPSGRKRFRSTGWSRQMSPQNTSWIPAKKVKKKQTFSQNTEYLGIHISRQKLLTVSDVVVVFAGCWWCRPACGRRAAWATVGWRQAAAAGTSPASVCFQATSVTAAPSRPPRSRCHRLHRHRSSPPLRPRSPLELIAPLPSAGPIRETPVRVSPVRSFSSVNYLIETKGIWIEWNVLLILIIFVFVTYIYICEYLFLT